MVKTHKFKSKDIFMTVTVLLICAVTVISFIFSDNILFNVKSRLVIPRSSESFVKFIDVGQGDSILIYSNGYSALIDTGPAENSEQLSLALRESGVDVIDVLMLSHLHIDHTGGVARVLEDFEVKNLILPELSTFSDGIYSAQLAIDKLTREGNNVFSARDDMFFNIGDFKVSVVATYPTALDENNRSLIVRADINNKSFLFTGDAEEATERRLLKDEKYIKCDVLKIGHHGSTTSTTADFLTGCAPKYGVITVGEGNDYGHPHRATLNLLKKRGIEYYRTDKHGDITFSVNGNKITVNTQK